MIKIGTRGSALALCQAQTVARSIERSGGPRCEIIVIRTSGDESSGPPDAPGELRGVREVPDATEVLNGDLHAVSGERRLNVKRLFVKEIENRLLEGRVDLAVHSSKDLPAALPDGLIIGAALEREDPRDAILLPAGTSSEAPNQDVAAIKTRLGETPRIGTSSVRRAAQLLAVFRRATFVPIRGNVDSRLRKLDAGECDALVLAVAGLKRLALAERISAYLPVETCVPAPGQGIVAVEIAARDPGSVAAVVSRISDPDAWTALLAERAVVQALGGGCQMPLGVLATINGQDLAVMGLVASLDGRRLIRATTHGNRGGAAAVGEKLAAALLSQGAAALLNG